MERTLYAHSKNLVGERQLLVDHLRGVARLARQFGAAFDAGDLLYWSGLWHDVGKADPEWQDYLERSEAGTWKSPKRIDHKAAGAKLAMDAHLWPVAFLIHAHHGGLQEMQEFRRWYRETSSLPGVARALANTGASIRSDSGTPGVPILSELDAEMFLRLAYSALVDADTLDTEAHQLGGTPAHRGSTASIEQLWERFEQYSVTHNATAASTVNTVRAEVLGAATAAAELPAGMFRLTVPTGGGKTRSAMAFALRHALAMGMRRVIVAVPFTTITGQTAAQYRAIFEAGHDTASPVVLEHHSAAGESADEQEDASPQALWRRAAAENWDAPIVVTTTVQLFESLFANKRNRMRKLHHLAKSVIILDEAQALPSQLLAPILDALKRLTTQFGASVVLATATQPAFEVIDAFRDVDAREIVPGNASHFERLARVAYDWRIDTPRLWSEVADWLRKEPAALTIVNTRRHATELLEELDDPDALHLSTLLCGAHRASVLAEIHRRLEKREPCQVVSTQTIEAGVDVDFPAVFRALGPLDSIIQAAGRCNREGRLDRGRMVVFRPPDDAMPGGTYRTGEGLTKLLVRDPHFDPGTPDAIARYSQLFFESTDQDAKKIQQDRERLNYPAVAEKFRMIPNDTEDVLVPYGTSDERDEVEALIEGLRTHSVSPRLALRRLRPYLVSIRKCDADAWRGAWVERREMVPGVSRWLGVYDERLGLRAADDEYIA